ncbi:MAG TPA: hypothetical protein HA254_07075 [Candidatus Diapherotrites archaeon]|uniref:DUF2238 domain-containing protein n=1 Tax=Candidatus Iainarchaeum sp. TaxID=3101447 RepID=A0A7J4J2T6_9ARCH|nr:hypothetical protein [Candidatus Diapherotrites archaeon]
MRYEFSSDTIFLLGVFLWGTLLGSILRFYDTIPHYDSLMHFVGGALISSFLVSFLVKYLSGFYFAVNVCITAGIAAIWEITEFINDRLFGLSGQLGLSDTMGDMIFVVAAALVINAMYWARDAKVALGGKI